MESTAAKTPDTFGTRLHMLRWSAGISQKALAAAIGVSRQSIGNWESGEHEPELKNAVRLADALGLDVHELLDITPVAPVKAQPRSR